MTRDPEWGQWSYFACERCWTVVNAEGSGYPEGHWRPFIVKARPSWINSPDVEDTTHGLIEVNELDILMAMQRSRYFNKSCIITLKDCTERNTDPNCPCMWTLKRVQRGKG